MKRNKMLSLGLMVLLGLSVVGISNGQVVRADTTGGSPVGVTYRGQVQNIGWQPYVSDGAEAGTDGKGFRVEALNIKLVNAPAGASILYQGHVQNIGWQSVVSDGAEMGTDGEGLRVEAFKLALAGMPGYSIEYRAHVQNIGWQPWVSDGAEAGTDGKGLRVEAIEIKIVKTADGSTPVPVPFVDANGNPIGNTPTGGTGTTGNSIVTFKDANLEDQIRIDINKRTGTIYKSDVANIKALDIQTTNITDISGIENLTNLTTLFLSNNPISDISPLKGLTNLTDLGLSGDKISDISSLKGLTNLQYLYLDDNQISDISSLKSLSNLQLVSLSNNKISDVSPLNGITKLQSASLNNNQISDISPLKGLTNLTFLNLSNNQISDADQQELKKTLPKCNLILASTGSTSTGTPTTGTTTIPTEGLSVTSTNANQIQVEFSSAPVDTSKVVFNVTSGGNAVPLTTSWNSTNTVATLTYDSNFPADTYVVDVKDGTTDLGSGSVSVKVHQIGKIKIISTILGVIGDDAYATYQVLDQYGNDITNSDLGNDISWTCGIGQISAHSGIIKVVPYSGGTLTQYTTADIKGSADNGVSINATLDVSPGMLIINTSN